MRRALRNDTMRKRRQKLKKDENKKRRPRRIDLK